MTQVEEERELRFLKSGETLWEQSDYIRKANIRIIGLQEEEERVLFSRKDSVNEKL